MPNCAVNLYAVWTVHSYTVTINANSGSCTTTSGQSHNYDTTFEVANPTRTGYTFDGWTVTTGLNTSTAKYGTASNAVSTALTSASTKVKGTSSTWFMNLNANTSGSVTLTANWTANTYTVNYTLNDGTHGATHPGSGTYDAAFEVTNPSRTGYTFDGWTVTSGLNTGTAKYGTASNAVSTALTSASTKVKGTNSTWFKNLNATVSGSVTLTANWTANTNTAYKLRVYQMNTSGTYPTTYTEISKTGTSDATIQISSIQPSYTGFAYSKSQVNGTSTDITSFTVTADGSRIINMYYTRNKYTVKFNGNNGSDPGDITDYYEKAVTLPTSTRTGYTFNGWYTAASGGTKVTSITVPLNGVTYYAQWSINTYTVTISRNNTDYGTVSDSNLTNVPYGTTVSTDGATLKFANSTTGYSKNVTASVTTVTGYNTSFSSWSNVDTITDARTITANFSRSAKSYTMYFYANGGSKASYVSKTIYYGSAVGNFPTSTRTGCTLDQWRTARTYNSGTQITTSTVWSTEGNLSVYAIWKHTHTARRRWGLLGYSAN